MNRYVRRFGYLAAGVILSIGLWGCGPSNPDQLSLRVTGFYSDVQGSTGLTSRTGTVSDLAGQAVYVEFTNYLEGPTAVSPTLATGAIVLTKVQAVYRIRETGKTLPTFTKLTSTEIGPGGKCYFGMASIGDEQNTSLISNQFSLPAFPFEIDVAYTGFGRYAGSEYRATGDFTLIVTGLVPPTEGVTP